MSSPALLYLVLALLFKLVGPQKVMRFFPPIVTGPIIILIGLNLSGTAITNASTCWWLALVAIAIIIVANIWGKGMVKIIPILLGVVGSYIVALIAGQVDFTEVGKADFVGLQQFVIAKFDLTSILVMAPIAIAAMMEHIGDMSAISSTTGKNFIADPGLHRTLLGDGLATVVAGMFGGPANTTYGENTGVLALSKVYDPRVIRLAALYAIILSFSPKFDALVNSIPTAIVGGVSFVLYGMISAVGVRNVVENKVDLTKSRNLIIAAVIFVSGLGFSSTGGITFTVGSADITLTGLAIAALCGVILNAILPGNDYEFGVRPPGRQVRRPGQLLRQGKKEYPLRRRPMPSPVFLWEGSLRRGTQVPPLRPMMGFHRAACPHTAAKGGQRRSPLRKYWNACVGRGRTPPLRRSYKRCGTERYPSPFRQGGRAVFRWCDGAGRPPLQMDLGTVQPGRCGERAERRQWRMKRSERVAAVKISSVRRKAAQKFWVPQQDHRPLRRSYKRCGTERYGEVSPSL